MTGHSELEGLARNSCLCEHETACIQEEATQTQTHMIVCFQCVHGCCQASSLMKASHRDRAGKRCVWFRNSSDASLKNVSTGVASIPVAAFTSPLGRDTILDCQSSKSRSSVASLSSRAGFESRVCSACAREAFAKRIGVPTAALNLVARLPPETNSGPVSSRARRSNRASSRAVAVRLTVTAATSCWWSGANVRPWRGSRNTPLARTSAAQSSRFCW
mmetsp:Transcript_430/g.944  ORF Transcript_430/g.944 Transcript_430/m.944 type:complete len:218 (-) Transcript_430:289-942(-)